MSNLVPMEIGRGVFTVDQFALLAAVKKVGVDMNVTSATVAKAMREVLAGLKVGQSFPKELGSTVGSTKIVKWDDDLFALSALEMRPAD